MIKVIIIDDERSGLIALEKELNQIPEIQILAAIQDSLEAIEKMEQLEPDLVFIDIDMPYLNGFQLLDRIADINFRVVFVTAYNHFAIKAFKYQALDYLLKPVDRSDLRLCLDNYYKSGRKPTPRPPSPQNFSSLPGKMNDTIALSNASGLLFLRVADIAYLEADGSYTHVVLFDHTRQLSSKSIAHFDFLAEDHSIFFKAHKSYLINLRAVRQYIRGDGGSIILYDNKEVPLSRAKKQDFLDKFERI